jgi:hypothetical protein
MCKLCAWQTIALAVTIFQFSTAELVRDLIIGFVPDEWLHGAMTAYQKVMRTFCRKTRRVVADVITRQQRCLISPEIENNSKLI